jgi:hypothetical protein
MSKEYINDTLNGKYITYNLKKEILINMIYKMGIPYNILELRDDSAKSLDPGTLKDGNGTLNYYDKDYKLSKVETYKDAALNGLTVNYHTNGKISSQGIYTNGIKNNDWQYWRTDGTKEKTIHYNELPVNHTKDTIKKTPDADFVVGFAENQPQPQGGVDELQKYVESNITYFRFNGSFDVAPTNPVTYSHQNLFMRFVVSATGKIYHIEFDKGFDQNTQENIKKSFRSMPPWVPGFTDGFPVEFYYSMIVGLN